MNYSLRAAWIPFSPGNWFSKVSSRLCLLPSVYCSLFCLWLDCHSIDTLSPNNPWQDLLTSIRLSSFLMWICHGRLWICTVFSQLLLGYYRTQNCHLLIIHCAPSKFEMEAYTKLSQTDQLSLKASQFKDLAEKAGQVNIWLSDSHSFFRTLSRIQLYALTALFCFGKIRQLKT